MQKRLFVAYNVIAALCLGVCDSDASKATQWILEQRAINSPNKAGNSKKNKNSASSTQRQNGSTKKGNQNKNTFSGTPKTPTLRMQNNLNSPFNPNARQGFISPADLPRKPSKKGNTENSGDSLFGSLSPSLNHQSAYPSMIGKSSFGSEYNNSNYMSPRKRKQRFEQENDSRNSLFDLRDDQYTHSVRFARNNRGSKNSTELREEKLDSSTQTNFMRQSDMSTQTGGKGNFGTSSQVIFDVNNKGSDDQNERRFGSRGNNREPGYGSVLQPKGPNASTQTNLEQQSEASTDVRGAVNLEISPRVIFGKSESSSGAYDQHFSQEVSSRDSRNNQHGGNHGSSNSNGYDNEPWERKQQYNLKAEVIQGFSQAEDGSGGATQRLNDSGKFWPDSSNNSKREVRQLSGLDNFNEESNSLSDKEQLDNMNGSADKNQANSPYFADGLNEARAVYAAIQQKGQENENNNVPESEYSGNWKYVDPQSDVSNLEEKSPEIVVSQNESENHDSINLSDSGNEDGDHNNDQKQPIPENKLGPRKVQSLSDSPSTSEQSQEDGTNKNNEDHVKSETFLLQADDSDSRSEVFRLCRHEI